jgi:hypothetical protein
MSTAVAFPASEPGRYAVVTKSCGGPVHTRSRHHSLVEASDELADFVRGGDLAGLEWSALYDLDQGGPLDPNSRAIVLCIFRKESAMG